MKVAYWAFMLVVAASPALGQNSVGVVNLGETERRLDSLEVDSLASLCQKLLQVDKYDEAFTNGNLARQKALAKFGNQHQLYAKSIHNLANYYFLTEAYDTAGALYIEAKDIHAKIFGVKHKDYGINLFSLANLFAETKCFEESEKLYLEAKTIFELNEAENHDIISACLNNLSLLYTDLARYGEAQEVILTSLHLTERHEGKESREYITRLNSLALVYHDLEDNAKAENAYLEAKRIAEKLHAEDSEIYSSILDNLASLYNDLRRFEDAKKIYEQGKIIRGKLFGKRSTLYSFSLHNLGNMYDKMGHYEEAEALFLEALDIRKEKLGRDHPLYASTLENLAILYKKAGRFEEAEPLYYQTVEITKTVLGQEHPAYARRLNLLAGYLVSIGRLEEALKLQLEAEEICAKVFGQSHSAYIKILTDLANTKASLGQYREAESTYLSAIKICGESKLPDSTLCSSILGNLALLYCATKRYSEAESALRHVHKVFVKAYGLEHPDIAINLSRLGGVCLEMGRFSEAHAYYEQAKQIQENVFGREHPFYVTILNDLSDMYRKAGDWKNASKMVAEASSIRRQLLQKSTRHLSENELQMYQLQYARNDLSLKYAIERNNHTPTLNEVSYDNLLFDKAFLLNSFTRIKNVIRTDSANAEILDLLAACHRQIAEQNNLPVKHRRNTAVLLEQANSLEKEIVRKSTLYSAAIRQTSWKEVQHLLRQKEATVEFIRYERSNNKSDSTLYAALLLRPGWKHPKMVYLFEEKQLIALFQNTGDEATVIKDTYQTDLSRFSDGKRASRLYNLLWKPLEKHLKGVKKIYYSPSGLLHSVAFAAIAPKPGEVLADKYDLEYVSCTRELVIGRQVLQGDPSLLRDAVIFGGISYPTDSFLLALQDPCRNCSRGERSVPKYLPGSLEEMKAISAMLSAHGVACDTFSAYRASEARLKMFGARTNLPSPGILHLSTHGYYLPDPKVAADSTLYDAPFKWADNPLFRSWLLMAGGTDAHLGRPNHLSSYDDGVLTAYEIASLNLSNTKLVVLSACQTGLGDLRNTEGVYGLQRAFKMAGAQHLLVTLWEVDDNATARFMQLFYGHWLDGLPIHDAFKKAQAEMKNIYPDPYFWAPFILI